MIVNRSEALIGRAVLIIVLILTLIPLLNMISAALQPADQNPVGLSWPTDPQ
jgi:raffinose/stachyose/melibiose transport system permease protein